MSTKLIRTYQKYNVSDIKPHLLVYGAISGSCANCGEVDIKVNADNCPGCSNAFHFITFREPKSHIPKFYTLLENNPNLTIIDHDDYKKYIAESKAKNFFDDL